MENEKIENTEIQAKETESEIKKADRKWYKNPALIITIAAVLIFAAATAVFIGITSNNDKKTTPEHDRTQELSAPLGYDEVKDHYGVYTESTKGNYSYTDKNGNKVSGYLTEIKAEMKVPMTREELLADALVLEKATNSAEMTIRFIYRLDRSYDAQIRMRNGEIVSMDILANSVVTQEDWIAGNYDD